MTTTGVLRDVTARGARLRVLEVGDGPPVVLLHGLLVNHSSFLPLLPRLQTRLRIFAPDFPGSGESEKPSPSRYAYGVETFAETIVDMISALRLGRVSLVGHSLGGGVAISLAAAHPELVDKLVLINPVGHPPRLDGRLRPVFWPLVGAFLFKQALGRALFRTYFRDYVYSNGVPFPLAEVDRNYDAFNTPAGRESALAVLQSLRDTRTIVARTSRIQAKTLLIWGRHDRILPPTYGQRLAREMTQARLSVLDTGQAPHEELPSVVSESILDFLEGTRSG